MAVIKSSKSDRFIKEAVVLDMGDLARQAERIIANARAEAEQVLKQARAEAQRLIDDADARGYNQGYARGQVEGNLIGQQQGSEAARQTWADRLDQLSKSWAEALQRWEAERTSLLHEAREDVVRFAFAVAQRVVHRIAQSDSAVVGDQLAEALGLLSRPTAIEVLIHPDDRSVVEAVLPELLATLARCEHAAIRDDAAISRGGCIVMTAGGQIDATIHRQLDRIAEALVPSPRADGSAEHPAPNDSHSDGPDSRDHS